MITLRLTPDIEARLYALVKKSGCTKSGLVCKAVAECIDDFEDLHLAQARSSQIESGKSKTLTLDEVQTQVDALPDRHRREVYRQ
jgi:RHH-type transcriptional regulator, rel operon repressor / antitoxin RelB